MKRRMNFARKYYLMQVPFWKKVLSLMNPSLILKNLMVHREFGERGVKHWI